MLPAQIIAVAGDRLQVRIGNAPPVAVASVAGSRVGERVALCLRAEDVQLLTAGRSASANASVNRLSGRIVARIRRGALVILRLDCGFPLEACVMAHDLAGWDAQADGATAITIDRRALFAKWITNSIHQARRLAASATDGLAFRRPRSTMRGALSPR